MKFFNQLVWEQLERIRTSKKPINSFHEGASIIREEYEEFWDEVKVKSEKRSKQRIVEELVDIVCGCQRLAEDKGLVDKQVSSESYVIEKQAELDRANKLLADIFEVVQHKAETLPEVQRGVFNGVSAPISADLCFRMAQHLDADFDNYG